MSLRDKPNSHKIIIPLVANLTINRAYDPSSGGIGGPGLDRTSLPESWINTPGADLACNGDPETDKYLSLWLDTADPSTLVLAPEETDPVTGRLFQRRVLQWTDKSGKGRHAVAHSLEHAPKLSKFQPYFPRSVDMSLMCLEPTSEAGSSGDPPPATCSAGTKIRQCLGEIDAPCFLWNDPDPTQNYKLWMEQATGDWRTGAGTVVALTRSTMMAHSDGGSPGLYEDGDLYGFVCPTVAGRALPGFDAIESYDPSSTYPHGIIFNSDPGKNGSVVVALAGLLSGGDTSGQELDVWFKDAGGTIDNSPAMAGRHVRLWVAPQDVDGSMMPRFPLGSGVVNSTGQLRICRCEFTGLGNWTGLEGDTVPGDTTLIIEIAAPGDTFEWLTGDTPGCVAGCGESSIPNPDILMNP